MNMMWQSFASIFALNRNILELQVSQKLLQSTSTFKTEEIGLRHLAGLKDHKPPKPSRILIFSEFYFHK